VTRDFEATKQEANSPEKQKNGAIEAAAKKPGTNQIIAFVCRRDMLA
jgi:hypothetical protein